MYNTIELKKFVLNLIDKYKDSRRMLNDELSTDSWYMDKKELESEILSLKSEFGKLIGNTNNEKKEVNKNCHWCGSANNVMESFCKHCIITYFLDSIKVSTELIVNVVERFSSSRPDQASIFYEIIAIEKNIKQLRLLAEMEYGKRLENLDKKGII